MKKIIMLVALCLTALQPLMEAARGSGGGARRVGGGAGMGARRVGGVGRPAGAGVRSGAGRTGRPARAGGVNRGSLRGTRGARRNGHFRSNFAHYGNNWNHGWSHGWGWGGGWWGNNRWGRSWYPFWISTALIGGLYAGYYPYWGYGLGYPQEVIVPLAREGNWDEIIDLLTKRLNDLEEQLRNSEDLSQEQAAEMKEQVRRIQAHLDGITQQEKGGDVQTSRTQFEQAA